VFCLQEKRGSTVIMVINMNKRSILNFIVGGIIIALATIGILQKYRLLHRLKENIKLKEEINAIPLKMPTIRPPNYV